VRDNRLGVQHRFGMGAHRLGKYLMRSHTVKSSSVVKHAFLGLPRPPGSSLCVAEWLSLDKLQTTFSPGKFAPGRLNNDHARERLLNSGRIITEPQLGEFVNVAQWLSATVHPGLLSFWIGHLWPCGRARRRSGRFGERDDRKASPPGHADHRCIFGTINVHGSFVQGSFSPLTPHFAGVFSWGRTDQEVRPGNRPALVITSALREHSLGQV